VASMVADMTSSPQIGALVVCCRRESSARAEVAVEICARGIRPAQRRRRHGDRGWRATAASATPFGHESGCGVRGPATSFEAHLIGLLSRRLARQSSEGHATRPPSRAANRRGSRTQTSPRPSLSSAGGTRGGLTSAGRSEKHQVSARPFRWPRIAGSSGSISHRSRRYFPKRPPMGRQR